MKLERGGAQYDWPTFKSCSFPTFNIGISPTAGEPLFVAHPIDRSYFKGFAIYDWLEITVQQSAKHL